MRLLLDSHALLWFLTDDAKLSAKARHAIVEDADESFVSAASAWEIATKHRLGKLPGAERLAPYFSQRTREAGLLHLPISMGHAERAGTLKGDHKDPFDRMLMAQAILDDLVLVSNETAFDAFGVARLW